MTGRNLYEVLGLGTRATTDEIRSRYRELARRYHPDVAKAPDAAEKFKEINHANQILSDPKRRAAYDAELKLAEARRARHAAAAQPRPGPPQGPPPQGGPQRPTSPRPSRPAPTVAQQIDAIMNEAHGRFRRMRFREAEAYCRQALRVDRQCGAAYELLGDIHRARGRADEALAMYSFVLQLDPNNHGARAKFDRMAGKPDPPRRTATGSGSHTTRPAPSRDPLRAISPTRAAVTAIGSAVLLFLVIVVARDGGGTPSWLPLEWSGLTIFALATSGLLSGLLLALNDVVQGAQAEFAVSSSRNAVGRRVLPLGIALTGFSLVWFYAAFAVFMMVAFAQETVSRSILRAFAASFGLVALFALVRIDSAFPLLVCGGNLVFPAFIVGWIAGDAFRDRS